jgi:tetratricopeptide (TPR) repeat protein
LPVVDRTVLRRVQAKSDALAREARDKGLTYDVRAVGDAFRRAGAATVEGKGAPESAMGEIVLAVRLARQKGSDRGLLALLALQAELFVEATKAFEKSGKPSLELGELGGDFLAIAKQNGWVEGRRILLDDDERAALFRVRWTELTGLRREAAFAPTLDEYRTYYSLYLRQAADADALRTERAFGVVRALEKRDPSYPGSFARGVLYYRKGLFDDAASAFRAHLAAHPDGPWTLRAKNHLLAALARGSGAD